MNEVYDDGAKNIERRDEIIRKYAPLLYDGLRRFLRYHGLISPAAGLSSDTQLAILDVVKLIEKEVNNV